MNSDGLLTEAAAAREVNFPGDPIPADSPEIAELARKFQTDMPVDITQQTIVKLDIVRLAHNGNESPEAVVARAAAYMKWIAQ